ncbi:MAG: hypothetical protein AAGG57_16865 [Pseudomonadota bacterium]
MRLIPALILCAQATLVSAAEPMTGAEFEAYTTGKTLFFANRGEAYGAEIYKENRRVVWSFLDGECKDGYWYDDGPLICFVYEDRPEPQCWTFMKGPRGLTAEFEGEEDGTSLYEAQELNEEMICLGPKIGV